MSHTETLPAADPVVSVRGLTKSYRGRVVVDHLDFDVQPGQVVGLIGANGAGKTTTVEMLQGLRTADAGEIRVLGLDPDKDAKFLATGTVDSRFAAMKQNLTAATLGSPPIDFLGKKLGFIVIARAQELFNFPASGLVATARKLKEKPDEVKRVIKAGIKANRYIQQNRESTIQVMVGWLKIDKEIAAITYDSVVKAYNDDGSVPESGLRLSIEEARRVGKVEREVAVAEIADLNFLREAQRELGIKAK